MTDAHIHNGTAGSNAGVYVNTALAPGEMAIANGSGSITKNGINVPSDGAAAILSSPAGHYFNVHTALNPDGPIRGQLSGGGANGRRVIDGAQRESARGMAWWDPADATGFRNVLMY